MSGGTIARRLATIIPAVVLVISGTYLLVYLYRWEWNRALVSGLFFVAAEVALIGTSLLRRLRQMEDRLERLSSPSPADRLRETAPDPDRHFAWLDPADNRMGVFVPVLIGAGVVLSVLAAAVERVAGATARPVLEDRLARRLDGLALPSGGLLGAEDLPAPAVADRRWRHTLITAPAAVLVLLGGTYAAVDVIADATQSRPDPPMSGTAVVQLEVARRNPYRDPLLAAQALFVSCRHTLGDHYRLVGSERLDDDSIDLTIAPGIGKHARRKLVGCLQDARFDRVSAHVQRITQLP